MDCNTSDIDKGEGCKTGSIESSKRRSGEMVKTTVN